MRSVRSALVGLGTLIILLTFVGFATFSPNGADTSRPEGIETEVPAPLLLAADAGATTGRVTAFVFANQLQTTTPSEAGTAAPSGKEAGERAIDHLPAQELRSSLSPTTTTLPSTTTTTAARAATTTTTPPTTTTTTEPPTTTTTTEPPSTTTTTEPPTTTSTVPSSDPLSEGDMRALASQYFPAEEVEKAVLVARCESNYDPSAYNPEGPYGGLYQHSLAYWDSRAASAGWSGASVYGASANTAVTAWLVARDGWGHWPWCSTWADGQLGG